MVCVCFLNNVQGTLSVTAAGEIFCSYMMPQDPSTLNVVDFSYDKYVLKQVRAWHGLAQYFTQCLKITYVSVLITQWCPRMLHCVLV